MKYKYDKLNLNGFLEAIKPLNPEVYVKGNDIYLTFSKELIKEETTFVKETIDTFKYKKTI